MTTALRAVEAAPFRELVAAEIRAHLARRKMSGRALSKLLDVDQTWVSRRLNGVIPLDMNDIERISDALGMQPMELLTGVVTSRYPWTSRRTGPMLTLVTDPEAGYPAVVDSYGSSRGEIAYDDDSLVTSSAELVNDANAA